MLFAYLIGSSHVKLVLDYNVNFLDIVTDCKVVTNPLDGEDAGFFSSRRQSQDFYEEVGRIVGVRADIAQPSS